MLDFTDNIGSRHSIKEAIQRGIVLSTLNKEYSDLTRELRYLSDERYINPNKVTNKRNEADIVKDAINLLERQYYDGLVAKT